MGLWVYDVQRCCCQLAAAWRSLVKDARFKSGHDRSPFSLLKIGILHRILETPVASAPIILPRVVNVATLVR
jgi:hypothetical protein